jgi:hypothetical protein
VHVFAFRWDYRGLMLACGNSSSAGPLLSHF